MLSVCVLQAEYFVINLSIENKTKVCDSCCEFDCHLPVDLLMASGQFSIDQCCCNGMRAGREQKWSRFCIFRFESHLMQISGD